ncbi:hypothetical protein V5O48_001604 [Marasmius crinis-equi]|uniref:F-box domain-containing protein n=1 Tax=Marasmius crinis-equi TaxID=585013 RepID=A0ABR3FY24_9AGAR
MDELDEDSIRQCALAARCFLGPARRRLFTKVNLCEQEHPHYASTGRWQKLRAGIRHNISSQLLGSTRCRQLAELLESCPEVGEFTEELIIEGLELMPQYRSWYNPKSAPLHIILPRLPNLKSISLLFPQYYPLHFNWLPPTSRTALVRAVQSPNIRSLVLENVLFEAVDDLIHFVRHAASGGHLTDLSITSLNEGGSAKEKNPEWKEEPIRSLNHTDTTNVMRSFHLVACPVHAEQVLQWVRGDDCHLRLSELSALEVVTPMTPEILRLVTEIVGTQLPSSRLQHLGLAYCTEPLHSPPILPGPLSQPLLGQAQHSLQSLTLYVLSRNLGDFQTLPPSTVNWWCSLLKTSSFPNLTEFRIHRRGMAAHSMLSGLTVAWSPDRFAENAIRWQRMEAELVKSAPNVTLRVELWLEGSLSTSKWKNMFFPDGDYKYLEAYFPLAHSGQVPLVIDMKVSTKRVNRRLRLREDSSLPKNLVKHRGHFVYTPETRWSSLTQTLCPRFLENASKTEFEYYFLDHEE